APEACEFVSAKRVVIAWRDAREARRAVADAMPFLEAAEDVCIVTVGEDRDETGAHDLGHAFVARGIPCRVVVEKDQNASVSDTLLQIAQESRADLLVAGAYGHSRLREWIFGGVTRELLLNGRVCCLLSN